MAAFVSRARAASLCLKFQSLTTKRSSNQAHFFRIHASQFMDDDHKLYKQLGLFSLKKKIEDAVLRAENSARPALDLEEARWIRQEEVMRESDLWDDLVKSSEILGKLAHSAKAVDALKDLKYKAEEAKLISQLADVEGINYSLLKQAYSASLAVNKIWGQYEMVNLLKGPYDTEGASLIIKAGSESLKAEMWAKDLLNMYVKWAKKLGCRSRLVEKHPSISNYDGIKLATVEFEFECAYGYLSGEKGIHNMINLQSGSAYNEVSSACVDVIPLFLGRMYDLKIKDDELIISPPLLSKEKTPTKPTVCIQHIPTGITVQSSGERSYLANKIKALNRLKAKLLVIAEEEKNSDMSKDSDLEACHKEIRRYISHPYKLVQDVKTGIQLPDLNSILDGNIEALIRAHIKSRCTN
ncbi:peptide chain release factor PrfB3, chloroplastic [Mercurialis annua]|uniref:peptide chain release factor PrfB3, chloroplastic n=1 Tax=Mercurialis annua TaxID=3986 RepID=UPI00215FE620|nr:peptide chain release factor PrfB3, chloroplastic [Mercurialis annua]